MGVFMDIQKCAIIGCGAVGATTAFALLKSGLFSEIVLIDIDKKKAEGEAMDLSHSIPFTKPTKIYAGDYSDTESASIIIITAGANQKPNETRLDIVNKNVAIFKSIIPEIVKYNKDAILLVVSNPVDILTYVTIKLSGFSPRKVIGSGTVLDTARLKYLMGEHLNIDSRNVHAFIIGEHGDSELPVWSSSNISGIDLYSFCENCGKCKNMDSMREIFNDVKESAYRIIEGKGATFYAVSMAVLRIVEAILRDENSVLTVSGLVNGHYGLHDVCIGLPTIVGNGGIKEILDIPLNKEEYDKLNISASTLLGIINKLDI